MPTSATQSDRGRARGALRDTVGALHNLEQLLKSIRVGPRALSMVIPDVHASCQRLPQTLTQLLGLGPAEALDSFAALQAFAEPRVKELTEALARVRRRAMTARRRLDLELVVARKTAELDAVRALADCLDEALTQRELHLDLTQLAVQALTSGGEAAGPRLHVALYTETANSELLVNPHLATRLVLLGLSWVTDSGTRPARVTVTQGERGATLEIEALDTAESDSLTVGVPSTIAPSLEVLKAAAGWSHAQLTERPGALRFEWGPERIQQS
ncbi:MAG: hypothetical protein KIT72_03305 [Polyangiaceae bacterium]|nr:hypothetical protein [Polyangiaceae bacterium]MCW5789428.1 hypothetical protein [Polyangiaceae bacterium]